MLDELAVAGLKILLLERGETMPLPDQNVADVDLFRKDRDHPSEQWFGRDGDPFPPQMICAIAGLNRAWGGVLERMREREFEGPTLQEGPTQELRLGLERQSLHPHDLPLSWTDSGSDPSGDAETCGLAGAVGQVGRNLMKPQLTLILQLSAVPNSGPYPRSLAGNDFCWGDRYVSFPLGSIQNGDGVLQDPLFAESPPVLSLVTRLMPNFGLERLAARSLSRWAMRAVPPDPQNHISLRGDRLQASDLPNNREAHTCRMGGNPATSGVDLDGRSHEVANLTIADAPILPGCPAVGPGLTAIANALRIANRLVRELSS